MPWSPANTTTRGRVNGRGGDCPWQAAIQTPSSSSRPSDPAGFTSLSCNTIAADRAWSSGGVISGNSMSSGSTPGPFS